MSKFVLAQFFFYCPWGREVRLEQAHQNLGNRAMVSFRLILSAVGTTLFKAQGGMRAKPEMKPWVHADKSGMSSVGAALPMHALEFIRSVVPPLWGSINVLTIITQGLRPGLCRSIALKGSSATRSKSMSVPRTRCREYDVLISVSTRTYTSEYIVLNSVSTRKYFYEYAHLNL